jgi:hypothetical protein
MSIFSLRPTWTEFFEVAVKREPLSDKAMIAFTVNDPRKARISHKCDNRFPHNNFDELLPPKRFQLVDSYLYWTTRELFDELVDCDFSQPLPIGIRLRLREYSNCKHGGWPP